jgi:UDP-N-acetylglucosamine--N-acetylmuramyl-(pentapeptide) pyrophosphoryl-undecaprenol N-acetylglucosamine transferase
MNRALVEALGYLLPYRDRLYIIHGVGLFKSREYNALSDTEARLRRLYGEEQLRSIEGFYTHRAFFHNIELIYSLSDLVVARAGAGSLNEISAMGLPALIIPKSNLPGDHQVMNARAMERAGGAEILYEQIAPEDGKLTERIDGKVLAEKLVALALDDARLQEMSHCSRSFLNADALARIERRIRGTGAPTPENTASAIHPAMENSLPGNTALVALLEKASDEFKGAYQPERVIPRPQDLEYLKTRASALLIHPLWPERNRGVKLLGLLHAREKIPALVALFCDRERVSLFKRLLGGDFKQVGFIRRNIVTALVRLNEISPGIEKALLLGLKDPYYEVRAESARAAAFFGGRLSSTEPFVAALTDLLKDPVIEVTSAAAEALGKVGGEKDALPVLLGMWDSKFWKVRAAVLRGILHLVDRGKATDLLLLEKEVPKFILTSTDFMPQFEIKSAYRELMQSVSRRKKEGSAK